MKRLGSLLHSFTRYTKSIGQSSHTALTIFFLLVARREGLVGTCVHDRSLAVMDSFANVVTARLSHRHTQAL